MKQIVVNRIELLKQELVQGHEKIRQLDAQRAELQQTLQRIAGAIQALEEVVNDPSIGD